MSLMVTNGLLPAQTSYRDCLEIGRPRVQIGRVGQYGHQAVRLRDCSGSQHGSARWPTRHQATTSWSGSQHPALIFCRGWCGRQRRSAAKISTARSGGGRRPAWWWGASVRPWSRPINYPGGQRIVTLLGLA